MTPSHSAPCAPPRQPLAAAMFDAQAGWVRVLHNILLFVFLEFSFIGLTPASEASVSERLEGSSLTRNAILAMFALALPVLAARREAAWRCVSVNWRFFAVLAVCVLSVAWSDYPDLTVRRSVMFVLMAGIAMGIAVSIDDLRAFHTKLFGALTAVVVVNLLVTAAFPSIGVSEIGVRGLYTQKNVAGMVGMLAVIVAVTWTLGCRSAAARWTGIAGALIAFGFLVITKSKTSIGLLIVTLGVGYAFQLALRLGPRFALLAFGGLAVALVGLMGVVIYNDFVWADILSSLVSDPTFTGRDALWAFCLRESLKRMWLGHGYGAFWDVGAANDPMAKNEPGTWIGDVEVGMINEAHNGYLELWLVIGLPAMLLAVWQVFSSISAMTGAAMRLSGRAAAPVMAMMAMILFNHLLHNATEATLFMRNGPFSSLAALFMLVGFQAYAAPVSRPPQACERSRA
jgi:O-antigen ligase